MTFTLVQKSNVFNFMLSVYSHNNHYIFVYVCPNIKVFHFSSMGHRNFIDRSDFLNVKNDHTPVMLQFFINN